MDGDTAVVEKAEVIENAAGAGPGPASGAPVLVAVDDGYAACKLVGVDAQGKPLRALVRSAVRMGAHAVSSLDGSGLSGAYETDGRRYTVFAGIEGEQTTFDGFHTSDLNRVLVQHVLMAAGLEGQAVDLVTAVPVKDYYIDGERHEELLQAKRQNLLLPVTPVRRRDAPGQGVQVAGVRVYSQAVTAWVDYVLDDDLQEREDATVPVAVVDIGGRTTDCAVVIGGTAIDHMRSGTVNLGVLDVYKGIAQEVGRRYELDGGLPLTECDRAVREGVVTLFGAQEKVDDVVAAVISDVGDRINREIHKWLGTGSSVGQVVFVGGGATVFKDLPGTFRHGRVAEDPEFANARGMFKYARFSATR